MAQSGSFAIADALAKMASDPELINDENRDYANELMGFYRIRHMGHSLSLRHHSKRLEQ